MRAGQGPAAGADPGQRGVALRCLAGACESGQLLVDVFVNYDCDLEGANLFERLVLALVRQAQAPPTVADASSPAAAEEAHLRLMVRAPALKPLLKTYSNLRQAPPPTVPNASSPAAAEEAHLRLMVRAPALKPLLKTYSNLRQAPPPTVPNASSPAAAEEAHLRLMVRARPQNPCSKPTAA